MKSNFFISLSLSVVLLFNLLIFVPFDIYISNSGEFITSLPGILEWMILPFLILLVFFAIIALILKDEDKKRYIVLLATLSLLVWFQSDVLLWEYGLLNGEIIDWSKDSWRGWIDLSIWIIALILSYKYHIKIYKSILQFAITIFVIQLLITSYNVVAYWDKINNDSYAGGSLQEIYKFSSKHNVLHILLDGFQSDIFDDLINNSNIGNILSTELDGFTFYKETLGVFPYTRFALPALMSGRIYDNSVTKDEFVEDVFKNKTILNVAYEQGYEVDIASEEYWAPRYALSKHTNSFVIPNTSLSASAKDFKFENSVKMLDLVLFKTSPHFIKKKIYNKQRWFFQAAVNDPRALFFYFSHTQFMQLLTKNMVVEREVPVYKYIHVMNTHNPMVLKPDCNFAGHAIGTTRASLTIQSLCTLDTVINLFNKMKALGIYDDSLIIMHADHGGWVKTNSYDEQIKSGLKVAPHILSLASPLLAIKQPKSKGKLVTSEALVSLADIPDTISDIMGWETGFNYESVRALETKEKRTRHYYYYAWQRDAWEAEYTGPIQEFIFSESHFKSDWGKLGKVYEPAGKNKN